MNGIGCLRHLHPKRAALLDEGYWLMTSSSEPFTAIYSGAFTTLRGTGSVQTFVRLRSSP